MTGNSIQSRRRIVVNLRQKFATHGGNVLYRSQNLFKHKSYGIVQNTFNSSDVMSQKTGTTG